MRTPPYRLNEVACTPNGMLHRLPSTSRNCRKRLRLAMRDSADADSVVQTQAGGLGRRALHACIIPPMPCLSCSSL
jgi:hypothetical protein